MKTGKHLVVFVIAAFFCVTTAHAQNESKMDAGIGLEWNMNSRENFAGGAAISFNYNLPKSFAVGLNVTASNNFSDITVLEPAVTFRRYFSAENSGIFAQAEAGAYVVIEDNAETQTLFMGGLRGGIRIPLGKFYVEPYGRAGYPFVFGIGANAGIRF